MKTQASGGRLDRKRAFQHMRPSRPDSAAPATGELPWLCLNKSPFPGQRVCPRAVTGSPLLLGERRASQLCL